MALKMDIIKKLIVIKSLMTIVFLNLPHTPNQICPEMKW